jgi:hypothetical protein
MLGVKRFEVPLTIQTRGFLGATFFARVRASSAFGPRVMLRRGSKLIRWP